jgi:quinol monooxygenase YgiN
MIFIAVKFKVKPDVADRFMDVTRDFTEGTRSEPGNLWFDWSRSVDDPSEYILLEAFKDDAAEAHVTSDHFAKAMSELPAYLQETPRIRNMALEGDDWDELAEMTVSRP